MSNAAKTSYTVEVSFDDHGDTLENLLKKLILHLSMDKNLLGSLAQSNKGGNP